MPLEITKTEIENVLVILPKVFGDNRGYFSETFRSDQLADVNFNKEFIQDNQSLSAQAFTLRGLHFQKPPYAQDKLVRVIQGSILDVAVDIRSGSPTYGKYVAVELTGENFKQLLVPAGFAHAFLTLEENTIVSYKVSEYYAPECDSGILWNDADLNIAWPIPSGVEPILSQKDAVLGAFKDLPEGLFPFQEFKF
jgi:dTDP-4-dehydrorhamnose 3,5-epimerase